MLNPWLLEKLACPRDHTPLKVEGSSLVSAKGSRYPIVAGVPIFLLDDKPQTIALAEHSLKASASENSLFIETLGLNDEEKAGVLELSRRTDLKVDPVASYLVAATNGIMYKHLVGRLERYPIPELQLPPGEGRSFLDLGCSWGRWCVAAAQKGYRPVGLDPSLGAVLAAKRVANQLGVKAEFIVGDARFPPFASHSFDTVFSYSVLQHFSREDCELAVASAGRVVKSGGEVTIQMPNTYGIRCLYHQARRGFKEGKDFDVRYWTPGALKKLFERCVGPSTQRPDCFFGIGLQPEDYDFMPLSKKMVLRMSNLLCAISRILPLRYVADSLYVRAKKP